jgi:hypothetical protein
MTAHHRRLSLGRHAAASKKITRDDDVMVTFTRREAEAVAIALAYCAANDPDEMTMSDYEFNAVRRARGRLTNAMAERRWMKALHRRSLSLLRQGTLFVVIVGFLMLVTATYPQGNEVIIPPGTTGVYENYELPGSGPTP